jgi:hypothetical protein
MDGQAPIGGQPLGDDGLSLPVPAPNGQTRHPVPVPRNVRYRFPACPKYLIPPTRQSAKPACRCPPAQP